MLKPLPADKATHALANIVLFLAGAYAAKQLGHSVNSQIAIGCGVAFAVSVAKEVIWDKALKRGTPDKLDMVANVVGIALGALVYAAGAAA